MPKTLTTEQIIFLAEISDEIQNIFDCRDEFTTGDYQAAIEAQLLKAFYLNK